MKVERVPRIVTDYLMQITITQEEAEQLAEDYHRVINFYINDSPDPYVILKPPTLELCWKLKEEVDGLNKTAG